MNVVSTVLTPPPVSSMPKRILAAFLAFVLAVGLLPIMPTATAYADEIASSAGSATATRTIQFYYDGEDTPFDSVTDTHTVRWGKGVNLSQATFTFKERQVSDYWTEHPPSWTFEPSTIDAQTFTYADAKNGKANPVVEVTVKRGSSGTPMSMGTVVVEFVDTKENTTIYTLTASAPTGTSFSEKFTSGTYAGKSLVDAVQSIIGDYSGTYTCAENPIEDNGTYPTDSATYKVKLTPKDAGTGSGSGIDTSVTVEFFDQYGNDIAIGNYLARINVSNSGAALDKATFKDTKFTGSNDTLVTRVQSTIKTLENSGYWVMSNNFPEDGKYGPTAQVFVVQMHKPSIEDGEKDGTITPPADVVYNGTSQKPEPTIVVNGKTLVRGTDYIAIYPGEAITLNGKRVAQSGNTVNAGIKEVLIVGWGDYAGYQTTTSYQILPAALVASISQTEFTYNGQIQRPDVVVTDASGNNVSQSVYTITWSNAQSKEAGSYTVEVRANSANYQGEASFVYTIKEAPAPERISIGTGNSNITVEGPAAKTYNGSKQEPGAFVVKDGNKTLVAGTDYTVGNWSSTGFTNAGSYTLQITGGDAYTGTRTITYTINKAKIASVELSANSLREGSDAPTYVVKDASGRVLTAGTDYTAAWNPTLDMNKADSYTLTATPKGNNFTNGKASATLVVSANLLDEIGSPSVTVDISDVTYNGTQQRQKPIVKSGNTTLQENKDYTLSYSGDTINVTNAGVTVTITGKGSFTGSRTVTYRILPAEITSVTAQNQVYTGQARTTVLTVKTGNGLTVPVDGYKATYSNNVKVGTATVEVKGIGNFTGSATGTFQITRTQAMTHVTVNFVDQDGNPISSNGAALASWNALSGSDLPSSMVSHVEGLIKNLSVDYKVDDAEWKALEGKQPSADTIVNIGCTKRDIQTVYIRFYLGDSTNWVRSIGPIEGAVGKLFSSWHMRDDAKTLLPKYVESIVEGYKSQGYTEVNWDDWDKHEAITADKTEYKIVLTRPNSNVSDFTVTVNPVSSTYNGSRQAPTLTVTDKDGATLVSGRDYYVSWSPNNLFVNAGTYTATVTGILSNGYTGTQTATYEINKAEIQSVTLSADSLKQGSTAPSYVVRDANGNTVPSRDYTATWAPSLDMNTAGTYTLTVKANSTSINYEGTASAILTVTDSTPATTSIAACEITKPDDVTYNGTSQREKPIVKHGNIELVEGTHYSLSYSYDTINAGTVTVTIRGMGDYSGEASRTYQINPAIITDVIVTSQTYNGQAKTPTPTVKAGTLIVSTSGYTIEKWENNTNVGEAKVTVKGTGNFTGSATGTFKINPARLGSIGYISDVEYTGSAQTPAVVVYSTANKVLTQDIDYTVSYENNTNVGTATAKVTGKGNYTGTLSRTFRIVNPDTGSTLVSATVYFKNSDGSDFAYINPSSFTVWGTAGDTPNETTVDNLDKVLANFEDSYDIDKKAWDDFAKSPMPNKNTEITITFKPKSSGGSTTPGGSDTPTSRVAITVTVKAVEENGSSRSTTYTLSGAEGSKFSTALLYKNVEDKIAELKDTGYTAVSNDTWNPVKNGTFNTSVQGSEYTITLSKPGASTGGGSGSGSSGSGGSTTPAQESYVLVKLVDEDGKQLATTNIWHGNTNMNIATTDGASNSLLSQANALIAAQEAKGYKYNSADNAEWENIKTSGKYPAGGTSWSSYKPITIKMTSNRKSIGTDNKSITAANSAAKTYNGKAQTPSVVVKDGNTTLKAGTHYDISWKPNTSFTNAGTYTATITGKGNYKGERSLTYTINKKSVTIPEAADKTYNGTNQRGVAAPAADAGYSLGGQVTAIKAGTYKTTATLTSTSNYQWSDGTTAARTLTWKINPAKLTSVTAADQTYDGKAKTPALTVKSSAISNTIVTSSGSSNSAYEIVKWENNTNAGTAKVTVKGKENFTGTVTGTFKINKAKVAKPAASNKTYNGKAQTGVAAKSGYTVTGGSATNAGSYTATAKLDANHVWSDGSTADAKIAWKIAPKKVNKPTASTLTYNGKEQTGVAAGADYTLSGTTKAKAVGTYTAKAVLKDKKNTTWSDGKTDDLTLSWKMMPVKQDTSVRVEFVDTAINKTVAQTSTWSGTTTVLITAAYNGESLKSQVDAKLAEQKKAGYTIKDQSAWDAVVKTGYYPAGGSQDNPKVIKITMSKPAAAGNGSGNGAGTGGGSGTGTGNGSGSGTGTPVVTTKSKHSITVNFVDAAGNLITGTNGYKFTATEGTAITAEFAKKITDRLAELKKAGWTEVSNPFKGTAEKVGAKDRTITIKMKAPTTTKPSTPVVTTATSIAKASVAAISNQTYTGKAITPKPKVTLGGKTLKEGTDYTLSYKNNTKVGTATVTVTGKGSYTGTKSATFKITQANTSWKRLYGNKALDTMQSIVKAGWNQTGGTVIIATSSGYWDALSAAGVAGLTGAPVLLVNKNSLPAQTRSELNRLKPKQVIIAGGTAAVSNAVANSIKSVTGVSPKRYAGATATGTAAALNVGQKGKWADTAIIATNKGFYDALSAAPISYAKHYPIFLTEGKDKISNETIKAIKTCGIKRVIVVGGTAAVSDKVVNTLKSNGISLRARLAGAKAIDTSIAIANWGLQNGMSANNIGVATQKDYYDALCGAALCGKNNAVLVLSSAGNTKGTSVVSANKSSITTGYVFGGPAAVSNAEYNKFVAASK